MKHLLLILVLVVGGACGKKKSSRTQHQEVTRVVVKGDPLTMISGTQQNKISFISNLNFEDFNNYSFAGLYIFAEKAVMVEVTGTEEDIEAKNAASEEDLTKKEQETYRMGKLGIDEYSYANISKSTEFRFKADGTKLNLTSFVIGGTEYDLKMEHYSLSTDKTKMNFLFRIDLKEEGSALISASFYKRSEPATIPKVSTKYKYLYGAGVAVPWKMDATRKITVDVCPSMVAKYSFEEIEKAITAWEDGIMYPTRKVDIVVNARDSCKPFSDVDEHSVHFVSSYLTIVDPDSANYGFTMYQTDLAVGKIYDADIVLLGSEIAKNVNYSAKDAKRTMTHEFGHFLGLDHMFDGDFSIMSYKSYHTFLGVYDFNAISNLYK